MKRNQPDLVQPGPEGRLVERLALSQKSAEHRCTAQHTAKMLWTALLRGCMESRYARCTLLDPQAGEAESILSGSTVCWADAFIVEMLMPVGHKPRMPVIAYSGQTVHTLMSVFCTMIVQLSQASRLHEA